jgi:exopolyphosphatase / guanosine-5'-triphosphate,3'-diphosphate pyrophosphatase
MNRNAVIAIGSNSIRLLVADANDSLTNSYRAKLENRLFMSLDAGRLATTALNEAAGAVKALQESALQQHAAHIDLIATSAVRDATNSQLLLETIKAETGLTLQILSGLEEAAYSFIGAAGPGLVGILDIGGGSTEMIIGDGKRIYASVSAQAGAARLYREKPINSENDIQEAMEIALAELTPTISKLKNAPQPENWKVTGGTGTTMAAVIKELPLESANPEGFLAMHKEVRDCLYRVASIPAEERVRIIGLPKSRTDIFPTGLCLLFAAMELLGIKKIAVTTRGNTDGWLRSAFRKQL